MSNGSFLALGSIEAVRPVFLIVMGVFLALIGWRLAKTSGVWTARWLLAGGMLLGFGYAVMLPMYEAGLIEVFKPARHYHGSPATAFAWHAVKLTVMNVGWLLFGIGIAMHANLLSTPAPRPRATAQPVTSPHESIA